MNIDFSSVLKDFKKKSDSKENIFTVSRGIIKESKQAIYAVHQDDFSRAKKVLASMKIKLTKIRKISSNESIVKVAFQEYVEAACFYEISKDNKLPSMTSLKVSSEEYLLGICDVSGELVRRAINKTFEGNYKELLNIKRILSGIYGELLKFEFGNGDLRRKFDKVKYDLIKIEEICLDLKLRGGGKCGKGKC